MKLKSRKWMKNYEMKNLVVSKVSRKKLTEFYKYCKRKLTNQVMRSNRIFCKDPEVQNIKKIYRTH